MTDKQQDASKVGCSSKRKLTLCLLREQGIMVSSTAGSAAINPPCIHLPLVGLVVSKIATTKHLPACVRPLPPYFHVPVLCDGGVCGCLGEGTLFSSATATVHGC